MGATIEVVGDVAIVPLTLGYVTTVDADLLDVPLSAVLSDGSTWTGLIGDRNWKVMCDEHRRYARCRVRHSRELRLHRLIAQAPRDKHVDHVNGNGLDNRRTNLRLVTVSQNSMNRSRVYGKTGFKGVEINGGTFRAQITRDGRTLRGKRRKTAAEAATDYDMMARELHGEFACTNADIGLL